LLGGDRAHLIARPEIGWHNRAACRGEGPAKFFRDERGPYTNWGWEDFCRVCPVRTSCLAYSLLGEEHWGVWGGFTPNARRRLLSELLEGTVKWHHLAKALDSR
jgi:WhiB family redox-sensing transcriptional regulator